MHVHVESTQAEAKFWIEPRIELAVNFGFSEHQLARILDLIRSREDEIPETWRRHFAG